VVNSGMIGAPQGVFRGISGGSVASRLGEAFPGTWEHSGEGFAPGWDGPDCQTLYEHEGSQSDLRRGYIGPPGKPGLWDGDQEQYVLGINAPVAPGDVVRYTGQIDRSEWRIGVSIWEGFEAESRKVGVAQAAACVRNEWAVVASDLMPHLRRRGVGTLLYLALFTAVQARGGKRIVAARDMKAPLEGDVLFDLSTSWAAGRVWERLRKVMSPVRGRLGVRLNTGAVPFIF